MHKSSPSEISSVIKNVLELDCVAPYVANRIYTQHILAKNLTKLKKKEHS